MRMVSPGDLTCRRALGDIGQMSGMMAATTQTALPRTGAHDPKASVIGTALALRCWWQVPARRSAAVGAPGKEERG
jgi:hypothetical protein